MEIYRQEQLSKGLERFKVLLETVKTYQPSTLFEIQPSWDKLAENRCPFCNNKLLVPRGKDIAYCRGKRHIEKGRFVIKLDTLRRINAR